MLTVKKGGVNTCFIYILISRRKKINGRLTGLVTFCVETAFYNGLLKER
jgi:hypothetical protein